MISENLTHTKQTTYEKTFYWVTFSLVFIVYLFNLGDLDALRQGTEGFYLKISKEMYEAHSYLTPLYNEAPHWSKPPLQFWATFPFYFVFGGVSLFAARLSIVLISLFGLTYISKWLYRHFNIQNYVSFIFFTSTIGFLKYSRIYMMEIPLTIFTICGSLLYFDYISTRKLKYFFWSAFILALSSLVKGPVSLVMAFGGIGLFHLYLLITQGRLIIKRPFFLLLLALLIGSIWYFISYINHGQEFINYFFLRENMGKFTAKSYPMMSVVSGLLIYSMPWTFFFPLASYFIYRYFKGLSDQQLGTAFVYLVINFFVFFFLWLIPSQRSHHYAIPSLPFFLMIILVSCFGPLIKSFYFTTFKKIFRYHFYFLAFLNILIVALVALILYFNPTLPDTQLVLRAIISLIILILTTIIFIGPFNDYFKFFSSLITISCVWIFLAPSFYLPMIPPKVVDIVEEKPISAVLSKPFFAEEAFSRSITVVGPNLIRAHIEKNSGVFIVPENLVLNLNLKELAKEIYRWPRWKRRLKLNEIVTALKNNDIESLKDYLVLLEK